MPERPTVEMVMSELPGLTRFATALCGNKTQAEDLVAAAVERSMPRWGQIDSIPAYLRRSIINLHLNNRRHDERHRDYLRAAEPARSSHEVDIATSLDIHTALAALTPIQRAVIVLRYFDQFTAEKAAEILGRPAGTVRRVGHEALEKLRQSPALQPPESGTMAPKKGRSGSK